MFAVLYSFNEPVYVLGFFTSWIRDARGISLCVMRIRADPDLDPKHWFEDTIP